MIAESVALLLRLYAAGGLNRPGCEATGRDIIRRELDHAAHLAAQRPTPAPTEES